MAKFSKVDYTHIAKAIRAYSSEQPGSDEVQEALENLVGDLVEGYRADNTRFDANRFRMAALGYVEVLEGGE